RQGCDWQRPQERQESSTREPQRRAPAEIACCVPSSPPQPAMRRHLANIFISPKRRTTGSGHGAPTIAPAEGRVRGLHAAQAGRPRVPAVICWKRSLVAESAATPRNEGSPFAK